MFYKNAHPVALATILALGLGAAACSQRTVESAEADAQKNAGVVADATADAGDAIQEGAADAGNAVENATRETGQAVEAGGDAVGEEVREESNDAARAADKATDGR